MSDHEKHTEFLRQCILYDESNRRQELHERITRIQRDARCVRRAVWLMAMLIALVVAGLSYEVILVDNFPYNLPQLIINLVCALGIGSLISLLTFMGLGMVYRSKLDQQREECRQLVSRLLESRLGKPVTTPLRDNRAGEEDARRIREMVETAQVS
ncbi:MAG TPA: hypothetical protein VN784_15960 [Candidatus Limnocylindrales bacterium]|nr:hypothetical protein [Candidatus Limnocylindrales bacterium]